jgi:hypothetical protein
MTLRAVEEGTFRGVRHTIIAQRGLPYDLPQQGEAGVLVSNNG